MIRNNSDKFSVDGGIPRKNGMYTSYHAQMDGTLHIMQTLSSEKLLVIRLLKKMC